MRDIYVMQRANGDVFALDDRGRFRIPLFKSSRDGFLARLRNFGMLLFKPVQLDDSLLDQLVPLGGAADVDFWLVGDPSINLNRGRLVQPAQLAVLMGGRIKLKPVSGNATSPHLNFSRPPAWMCGKLDFGSRLQRFMLFDEFNCLHLLPDSLHCANLA